MLSKIRLKSKLFFKYIISNFIIFLIPFLIMSGVIYKYSVINFQNEMELAKVDHLSQAETIISERMQELDRVASRIAHDPQLTPYMIQQKSKSGETIQEIKNYKANNAIIDEIFIHLHDHEKLYASTGVYSFDTWLQLYDFQDFSKEDLMQDIQTESSMIFPATENKSKERMIVKTQTIIPNNPHPHGTVIYLIKESVITDILKNVVGDYSGSTYIVDQNREIIGSYEGDPDFDLSKVDESLIENEGMHHIEQQDESYFIAATKSSYDHWDYLTVMKTNQFAERVIQKKAIVITVILSIFLFGVILAVVFAIRQYLPIGHLFRLTRGTDEQDETLDHEDELESIQKTITESFESQQSLSETIDLQMPYVEEQLLVKLLRGDWSSHEDIDQTLEKMGIFMYDQGYFVAILNLNLKKEAEVKDIENFSQVIANISLKETTIHTVDLLDKDMIALIVSMDVIQADETKHRRQKAIKIQEYLQTTKQLSTALGVGNIYKDKSFINRSYIEALTAIDYQGATSAASIIHFEDIHTYSTENLGYLEEEQMKLKQSLNQGDPIVAVETLQIIFSELMDKKLSVSELKFICYDIINTIIKTATDLDLPESIEQLVKLIHFESLQQLEEKLQAIIVNISEQIEQKRESQDEKLRKDILDYVHENFKLYDLSLEKLADHLELSPPYLSRYFKEQIGITFTQYVFRLRLEEVKRNLVETDRLIKDIVVEVGYQDVSNFTRQFRKTEGITPGQYRKQNRK